MKFGERVDNALAREIKEELDTAVKKISFIGVVDNIFKKDGEKHHEINLVFEVKTKEARHQSQENHIEFAFLNKKDFTGARIYPIALKKALLKWFRNKKIFWTSQ